MAWHGCTLILRSDKLQHSIIEALIHGHHTGPAWPFFSIFHTVRVCTVPVQDLQDWLRTMYMTLRVYRSGWLMLSSSLVIGMELLIHAQTSAVQIWMTCMTFTFWPGNVNGTWHIVPSLAEFVPHMTRIGQIGMEPWSGHCKNFKRPAWLDLTSVWHLMSCVYTLYQVNRTNRHRTDMWPWPFDLEVVCDASSFHGFYLCLIWSESVK